ncbi:hypothetical protein J4474_00630 [Candidatus Pacearchaeota archaeon]|nr:hypothetical protein [Candidatus Pacearchaeota archaeon]
MKKELIIVATVILLLILLIFDFYGNIFYNLTGKVSNGPPESGENFEHSIGPTQEEQQCMRKCVTDAGCVVGDVTCSEKNNCLTKCNIQKPETTEETSCMESCVAKGCGEFDFSCQGRNQAVCEKECDMIKEPEAKSEEEQCIRDCVNKEQKGLICQAGEGGEKGNAICQSCAKSCEHLYAGPCLTEMKLEEAKSVCNTCEHCYGKPVMGDSGEGYECIISIECADASSEFGDDPGTGAGIGQEGFVANVVESVGDFFRNIFGGEEKNSDEPATNSESNGISQ